MDHLMYISITITTSAVEVLYLYKKYT